MGNNWKEMYRERYCVHADKNNDWCTKRGIELSKCSRCWSFIDNGDIDGEDEEDKIECFKEAYLEGEGTDWDYYDN